MTHRAESDEKRDAYVQMRSRPKAVHSGLLVIWLNQQADLALQRAGISVRRVVRQLRRHADATGVCRTRLAQRREGWEGSTNTNNSECVAKKHTSDQRAANTRPSRGAREGSNKW